MASRRSGTRALLFTAILVAANLVVFQLLLARWPGVRLDLTRDHRYSIHPASAELLRSLEEDVTIVGYFSQRTHPKLAPLVPEIRDFLEEYRAASGGRVRIDMFDPGESEAVEQEANDRYGVQSTPFRLASKYETGIVNAYFALVVKYGDQYERYGFEDLIQVDPLPDGDVEVRLRNLEYDLTRGVKRVVSEFRESGELFDRIEGPVTLTGILSPASLPELFAEVPDALREAARELEEKSGGKFRYEELDPTVDAGAAARAQSEFGARPMSLGLFGEGSFYLYCLLRVGDYFEQIPLVEESRTTADIREAVEAALRRATPGFLQTVGLVTPEPDIPPEILYQLQMQGQRMPPPEYEQVRRFLEQDYQVERVELSASGGVPASVDVLVVIDPRQLPEIAVYNLDQYLMRGGRVVLCAGRYRPNFDQQGLSVVPVTTGLDAWLAHFGIDVAPTLVLDDRNQPLPIPQVRQTVLGPMRTWSLEPYPYLVSVQQDGFANREVTGGLDAVGVYWGSPLTVQADSLPGVEVYELLRSSSRSWTDSDLSRTGYVDYEVPADSLAPLLLAASLSGRFESYYAARPPPAADSAAVPTPLPQSPETRLTVVANAAFLSDLVAGILSQPNGGFFVENLRFLENVIDWSTLENDLIAIRSQGAGAARLPRLESAEEIGFETLNYLLPLAALVLLGVSSYLRRRGTRPITQGTMPERLP